MPMDNPDKPSLDQLNRLGAASVPPRVQVPAQAPAPAPVKKDEPVKEELVKKEEPKGVKYTPGDETDKHRGHGGDYYIDERGHRVPVK